MGSGDPNQAPHDYEASVFPIDPHPAKEKKLKHKALFSFTRVDSIIPTIPRVPWGHHVKAPRTEEIAFVQQQGTHSPFVLFYLLQLLLSSSARD